MSIQDEKTRNLVEAAIRWWQAHNPSGKDTSSVIDRLSTPEEKQLCERVYEYIKARTRNSSRGKWSK